MRVGIISLSPQYLIGWGQVLGSIARQDFEFGVFLGPARDGLPAKILNLPTILVDSRVDVEGPGYFLNLCVERAAVVSPRIDRFLVLGAPPSEDCSGDVEAALSQQTTGERLILGMSATDRSLRKSDILGWFRESGVHPPTSGGVGFMVFDSKMWRNQEGFREDTGAWGVELHFALAALGAGESISFVSTGAALEFSEKFSDSRVVSGLVAHRENAKFSERLLGGMTFLAKTFSVKSPFRSLYEYAQLLVAAREALRSRQFLKSGR